jgi:protein TonB
VSENRFLQSFCAFVGAAILVCGTHLFLLATADWNSATLEVAPSPAPAPAVSIETSTRPRPAGPIAQLDVAPASVSAPPPAQREETQDAIASMLQQPPAAAPPVGDQTPLGAENDTGSIKPAAEEQDAVAEATPDAPEVNAPTAQPPAPAETAETGLDAAPASVSAPPPAQLEETQDATASTQDEPPTVAAPLVSDQTPLDQENDAAPVEPAREGQEAVADATPEVNQSLAQPPPVETTETGAHEVGDAIADSDAPLKDAVPPAVASEDLAPVPEQNGQAPSPQQAEATEPQEKVGDGLERTASILTTALEAKPEQPGPQIPLPQRAPRPAMEKPAAKLAAKPEQKLAAKPEQKLAAKPEQKLAAKRGQKLAAKPDQKLAVKPEQKDEKSPEATQQWKPMALAPADKPAISLTQGQPKRLDGASYNAKIWSALARHKPNAGERGSTTVTFAIGSGGALRFVRVSQSSGNSRLDQLALATVRSAAPFPPPPAVNDAAYTIRIDFH